MTPEFGPEMVTPWSATRLSVKNSVDEQPIHDVTALGAPQSVYNGGLLRARVRYFDPEKRRAGIPDEVAALVEGMTDTTTTLSLVNISPVEGRKLIVQAGAYGAHEVTSVEHDGETYVID